MTCCIAVQSIRTFALGRMLCNLPCQFCDLLPLAITSSSIEKIKVVPCFVCLFLLDHVVSRIEYGGCESILTLSMTPWRLKSAYLPGSPLPMAKKVGRALNFDQCQGPTARICPIVFTLAPTVVSYISYVYSIDSAFLSTESEFFEICSLNCNDLI